MKLDASTHKPIVFHTVAPIRFTDIDRYGHVSTAHYIEYLFTSRFDYLRDHFDLAPEAFIKAGVGFVARKITFEFLRPIPATQPQVAIESWTPRADRSMFIVEFKIHHPTKTDVIHATGEVDLRCLNLKEGKPCDAPDWLLRCFFVIPKSEGS